MAAVTLFVDPGQLSWLFTYSTLGKKGDVIDAGANIGFHSLDMALTIINHPYKVFAIEPKQHLHSIILEKFRNTFLTDSAL